MKSDIVEAFAQMTKEKKIDRDILESVIKDSFWKMMEKKYGIESNFEVIVNMEKGNIEIFLYKSVVEEIDDPVTEIDIATAKEKSCEEFEVGDDYVEEIQIEYFGRRLVLNLKQNLNQKIREIEKEVTFNIYKEVVGDIIVGEVYQIKPNSILLIHNSNEVIFPRSEQIQKERYKKGDTIRAIVESVEKRPSGPPLIIVSRADEQFLYKLFELEIPEVYDGIIEIKSIAREPGDRAKIAVFSNDDRIDAVGACVGMKGIRIHSIVRELSNENIDVVNYTEDNALYIARALSPAKLQDIYLDTENKVAKIYADEDQVSLIIGKNGQNIKLASKLTGFEIDVIREGDEEEDVEGEGEAEEETAEEEKAETQEEEITEDSENTKKSKTRKKRTKKTKETEEPAEDLEKEGEIEETKKVKTRKKRTKKTEKTEEPTEDTEKKETKKDKAKKKRTKKAKETEEVTEGAEKEEAKSEETKKDKVKKKRTKKAKEIAEVTEGAEKEEAKSEETKKDKVKKKRTKTTKEIKEVTEDAEKEEETVKIKKGKTKKEKVTKE
jgi:N utilization substance protein A